MSGRAVTVTHDTSNCQRRHGIRTGGRAADPGEVPGRQAARTVVRLAVDKAPRPLRGSSAVARVIPAGLPAPCRTPGEGRRMDVRVRGGRRSRRPATLSSGVPPTRPEDARPMTVQHVDPALQDRFREVMAQVPTPVSVVTSMGDGFGGGGARGPTRLPVVRSGGGGLPHGPPVGAFASLSMPPPMVLVSLDRGSDLLALVRETGRFGVNVLGAEQSALALAFARKGGTGKFSGVRWDVDHGLPRLPGAPGWLACDVSALVEGGDHVVALGTVVAAETLDGRPLTYHGRVFGTHAALEVGA